MRGLVRPGDFIVAALVAAAAVLLAAVTALGADGGAARAEIYVDGALAHTLPLDADRELLVETAYGWNLILVESGGVSVAAADCPGQECVHAHAATQPGTTIACLPHRLLVRVAGGAAGGEVDAVAW